MFVSVKFRPSDSRIYTYAYDGEAALEAGQAVYVETKDGQKVVTVHAVGVEEPAFQCKQILGPVPPKEDAEPVDAVAADAQQE